LVLSTTIICETKRHEKAAMVNWGRLTDILAAAPSKVQEKIFLYKIRLQYFIFTILQGYSMRTHVHRLFSLSLVPLVALPAAMFNKTPRITGY